MRFFATSALAILSLAQRACALTWHGADFSSLANLEKGGLSYKDNGATTKFETILKNHGVNLARIRIWTSTNDAQYSLNYGLALAKRATNAGMQIMVDFHYSDTCAFESHQNQRRVLTPDRGRSWQTRYPKWLANRPEWAKHQDLYVRTPFIPNIPHPSEAR